MKLPGMALNLEGVVEFLLRHGEKIVGTLALLGAAWLTWSGIDAARSMGVKRHQLPEEIRREAERADGHVGRAEELPKDFLAAHAPLVERLDSWRLPLPPWRAVAALEVADPPPLSLLDKPLFEELAKRTKPDVFPLEELHAVAGIGLFATKAPAGGKDVDEADRGAARRLAPYVVVTGLIPARRQQDEYRSRFQGVGFKEAKRDAPLWSDFELERTVVIPGMPEKWESIDLAAAARSWARDWAAMQSGQVPTGWLLATSEDARYAPTTPVAFVSPLPERLDDGWGLDDLHPRLISVLAAGPPAAGNPGEPQPPEAVPGGPGFAGVPGEQRPAGSQRQQPVAEAPAHRLLRFIDTNVESGRTYKYRARLKVWNPNLGLAPQHLADPALAKEQKLASPPSSVSNTATVPGTTRILAGLMRKDDAKRLKLKPGTYEMLVLAPRTSGAGYALRAIYGELGSLADVDAKTARSPTEIRSRGEAVTTGRLLVDARGRQEDREPATAARVGTRKPDRELVPEPLEMLYLRPDGSFEFVSAADAERDVVRHADTLPAIDGLKREDRRGPPDEGQPVPEDPFAAPAAGRRP